MAKMESKFSSLSLTVALLSVFFISVQAVIPPYLQNAMVENHRRHDGFHASRTTCCRLGERAARQDFNCTIQSQDRLVGNWIFSQRQPEVPSSSESRREGSSRLENRIDACADSIYSSMFEICCNMKKDSDREMRLCRINHVTHAARRRCKQEVRAIYNPHL